MYTHIQTNKITTAGADPEFQEGGGGGSNNNFTRRGRGVSFRDLQP